MAIFGVDLVGILFVTVVLLFLEYILPNWYSKTLKLNSGTTTTSNTVKKKLPGPVSLPILGTRWVFFVGRYSLAHIHHFYRDLYKKYGPIVKEEALFNVPVISIFEKPDIEMVLKTGGRYPLRPPTEAVAHYRRSRPDLYASEGLVNAQGEQWHHLRSALAPSITSPRTVTSFLPQAEQIVEDWCQFLRRSRSSDNRIEAVEIAADYLALEMTCALVLGRRMGFLSVDGVDKRACALAQTVREHFRAIRDTYYGLPLWKFLPHIESYRRLIQCEEKIYDLAMDLVRDAASDTNKSPVCEAILNAHIDEREKTAAIVDFIASGIHTLKNSLLFLMHQIAENHRVQDALRQNCDGQLYAKACMTESFRLLPTANCLARITDTNLTLSNGCELKAGSVVVCHTGIACRNESYFNGATEFRPERWLDDEKNGTVTAARNLMVPFGAGRRICPGKRFIEHVLPIIIDILVRNFEISTDQPLELVFEFLLAPVGPISMVFQDRTD